ncbi:MAG TPA: tetratricopeptide repeat protein [Anaerolineales bacterium]
MAEGEFALMQNHVMAALAKCPPEAPGGREDLYVMLADSAAQQRAQAELQKYAPLAEETARRIDHKLYMAVAHRAWGVAHTLAAEYPQAEARLQQALEIFAGYPAPWQVGRSLFDMGELARAQGNRELARSHFSGALEAFEGLRAAPFAAGARAALQSLGPA